MKKWIYTFKSPENEYKPKIRYWIPHGVVSEKGLVLDVADIARRGFGSIEVVSMTRGLRDGFFTRENTWGSDKWLEKINIILREADKYGLKVDISNGPGWPIVDIDITHGDDERTLYELAYGLKILEPGEKYEGDAPLPEVIHEEGTLKCQAVSMYRISDIGENVLDFDTYKAFPVYEKLSITAPTDGKYALFAFYGRPSMQKYGEFYVMDHFSQKAADSVMDCWEHKILPALSEHAHVIENIFCDSLEYRVDLEWTRTFAEDFEKRKGYSILPYLPALGSEHEDMPSSVTYFRVPGRVYKPSRNESVYPVTNICCYTFSDKDLAHKVNIDYLETITHLYNVNHVGRMQERAEKLGLDVRYQVAYGRTLEIECSALYPKIPENEGLGGMCFDRLRLMAGAAHLARKPIYSFECAAEGMNSYGQTHEDILWWAKRAYASGINAQVLHGGHYCGYYDGEGNENGLGPGINWPGFEGFTRRTWTNAWNRTLDVEGQKNVWDYMARANFLLRHTHKVDLAIYHQSYGYFSSYTNDGSNILKDDNWLNQNGFTYEFLSSKLINHKNCVVQNGVLDWDGASYKALIIDNQEFLDYNTALKLKEFSDNGLPVIFVGKMPTRLAMFSENHKDEDLNALLKSISAIYVTNIRVVPSELAKIGILPDTIPNSSSSMLYPVHLKVGNASFYYVYNGNYICMQNPETFYPSINKERHMHPYSGELKLRGEGEVYELNGFDGTVKKIHSVKTGEYVKFNTSFVRDEAKMFAVLTPEQAKELGISAEYAKEYELESITALKNWTLDITEILPPEGKIGTFYESVYKKKEQIKLNKLLPWCEIEGLNGACGIGVYKTKINIDSLPQKALLCLENVNDTYSVKINGKKLQRQDIVKKQTDISEALIVGENDIEITVYTTIQNVASLDFLLSEGAKSSPQKLGIWGNATVEFYN